MLDEVKKSRRVRELEPSDGSGVDIPIPKGFQKQEAYLKANKRKIMFFQRAIIENVA